MRDSRHNYESARGRAPSGDETDLRRRLREGDAGERECAALGLVDVASDGDLATDTVALLRQVVTDGDDPRVRQFAVEALGYAPGDLGRDAIERALDDPEPWVRAEAVVALCRVDPTADAIREALEDEAGWVRRNAVVALGKTGEASTDLLVDRITDDPHDAVREYACQYLRDDPADVERCVRVLAAVLARDPGAFVRAKAADSLGDLGTDRAIEALQEFGVSDRSDDVQRAAKQALAHARGVDPEDLDVDVDGDGPDAPGGGPDRPPAGPGPAPSRAERGPRGGGHR
jgi:HEAT repeat protein